MDYIIDDRLHIQIPSRENIVIGIVAQKRGKNGNIKKRVALRAAGGAHTDEQIARLVHETENSNVTINIVVDPDCEVIDDERKFLKIVKNMMK